MAGSKTKTRTAVQNSNKLNQKKKTVTGNSKNAGSSSLPKSSVLHRLSDVAGSSKNKDHKQKAEISSVFDRLGTNGSSKSASVISNVKKSPVKAARTATNPQKKNAVFGNKQQHKLTILEQGSVVRLWNLQGTQSKRDIHQLLSSVGFSKASILSVEFTKSALGSLQSSSNTSKAAAEQQVEVAFRSAAAAKRACQALNNCLLNGSRVNATQLGLDQENRQQPVVNKRK